MKDNTELNNIDKLLSNNHIEFWKEDKDEAYISICRALERQVICTNTIYLIVDETAQRVYAALSRNTLSKFDWEVLAFKIRINGIWDLIDTK